MVAAAIKIQSVWRMHAAKKMCRRMRGTVEATTANDETTFDNFVTELAVTTLLNRKPKQNPLNHRMSVSGPGFMPLQEVQSPSGLGISREGGGSSEPSEGPGAGGGGGGLGKGRRAFVKGQSKGW